MLYYYYHYRFLEKYIIMIYLSFIIINIIVRHTHIIGKYLVYNEIISFDI